MRLVIDANRVIAATLTDGPARWALQGGEHEYFAPIVLGDEVHRHLAPLAHRTHTPVVTLEARVRDRQARIAFVASAAVSAAMPRALAAMNDIDPDDAPYLACALAVQADAIWSHDKHFLEQTLVPVVHDPPATPE